MSVTAQNDITCYKGENVRVTFTMSPVESISGWTITLSLKKSFGDAAVLSSATATHSSDSGGIFFFDLGTGFTDNAPGRYVYDVQRTDAAQVAVLSIGSFIVNKEVRT